MVFYGVAIPALHTLSDLSPVTVAEVSECVTRAEAG